MQVLWMVLVTLGLALSGVLGLAVVSHAAARMRRRPSPAKPSTARHHQTMLD